MTRRPRSVSLEKKSSEKDKGTKASQRGSASDTSRKKSLNIFERLRLSKQDKIAEQKIQKIRAVRAAEDLDRRVNAKRSEYIKLFHLPSHLLSRSVLSCSSLNSPVLRHISQSLTMFTNISCYASSHLDRNLSPASGIMAVHARQENTLIFALCCQGVGF